MRQPTAESARVREEALRVAGAMGAVPGVESVILFGSAARGTATEWSDCDLAVLARSREACERAGAVADERLDGALHVVGMHPGNGYAGAAVWGTVGCEACGRAKPCGGRREAGAEDEDGAGYASDDGGGGGEEAGQGAGGGRGGAGRMDRASQGATG